MRGNLDLMVADFVGGGIPWYPVAEDSTLVLTPDVFVVAGRPKGRRDAYRQWEEDRIAPKVVVEVWNKERNAGELSREVLFCDRHGVSELYVFVPHQHHLVGWVRRRSGRFLPFQPTAGYSSPSLGASLGFGPHGPQIARSGVPYLSLLELETLRADRAERQVAVLEAVVAGLLAKLKHEDA